MFVTYVIVKRFQANEPPLTQEQIVSQYKLPIRLLNTILTDLTESQIIASTKSRKGVKAYLPAIDINQLTLKTMEMKLDMKGSELFLESKNEEMDAFWQKMIGIQEKSDLIHEEILLKDL